MMQGFFNSTIGTTSQKQYPVFFIAGQSNAVGSKNGYTLTGFTNPETIDNTFIYTGSSWDLLTFPTNNEGWIGSYNGSDVSHGIELRLGQVASAVYGRCYIIKYALGWSGFNTGNDYWLTSYPDRLFNDLVVKAQNGLSALSGVNTFNAGFIWIHGETDSSDSGEAALYETRLYDLVDDFRTAISDSSLPFVFPAPREYAANIGTIRTAMSNVASNRSSYYLPLDSTSRYVYIDDNLHWNSETQNNIAEDVYNLLL